MKLDDINIPDELIEAVYNEIHSSQQYIKLKKQYDTLSMRREYAKAMIVKKKMENYEVEVFDGILKTYVAKRRISEGIVESMSVEDRKKMNTFANAMLLLSDVLDAMTMDAQSVMKKYTNGRITDFEKLNNVLKETKSLVSYFDGQLKDEKAQMIFGETSDDLYKLVFNKSKSFVNKLKKHAEDINKNAPSSSEVA